MSEDTVAEMDKKLAVLSEQFISKEERDKERHKKQDANQRYLFGLVALSLVEDAQLFVMLLKKIAGL